MLVETASALQIKLLSKFVRLDYRQHIIDFLEQYAHALMKAHEPVLPAGLEAFDC